MTQRRVTTFRIDEELLDGLRSVEERDGILVSEQVRRSIRDWLEKKGVSALSRRPQKRITQKHPA